MVHECGHKAKNMKRRSRGKTCLWRAVLTASAVCLLGVPSDVLADREITVSSSSGIRTVKLRSLRELRRRIEDYQRSGFERGQTFGAHFERAQALCATADKLLNGHPADDDGATKAMAEAEVEMRWLTENEPRRAQYLLRQRQLADLLLDLCERLNVSLNDGDMQEVTGLMKQAATAFEQGELVQSLELFSRCDQAIAARMEQEIARLMEQVRSLMAAKSWDKALDLLQSLRQIAPKNEDVLKQLATVRQHAVTTLRVTAWMNGQEVPAVAYVNGEWEKMPFVRDVAKGEKVSLRVVSARGLEAYGAATAYYVCDWFGEQAFKVDLQPVEGPRVRRPWKVAFPGTKATELELCFIRPGEFLMGRERGDQSGDQRHPVELRHGYWLGKHEVTQAQWSALMERNPSFHQGAELPVENVSWEEAMLFCRKLTNAERQAGRLPEGYAYTLPTEAQWEYACRAGSTAAFSFGDDDLVMSLYGNVAGTEDGYAKLAPVGKFRANAWGLHDMHGNVAEWCQDLYGTYAGGAKQVEPTGPEDAEALRVHRGGSWQGSISMARSYARDFATPSFHDETIGFRVALVRLPRRK